MAARVPPDSAHEPHQRAARLTSEQVSAINRFPDDNPNPVMRIDADGHLIYANPASGAILRTLGISVGDPVPAETIARFDAVAPERGFVEFVAERRTYAVWPIPIGDLDFTNLYGMDVTAERAIVKFPDQNPNPVLRIQWDGTLAYANPASAGLVAGLGLSVGTNLPAELRESLLERVRAADGVMTEIESGGRTYALLPVDVPEFGFINVYGTDVTAVKERERLARENERLLLNILPEPIAGRLRDGEPLIADRFDDVTLLFADIVEFTRLSSTMSPQELVGVLNEVFTVFDALVDRYGLEKVKTIGDAYMVVGGMPERTDDHPARVAAMALDLADSVGRIEAAARLGITFRIGIHCGAVVAGVIGTKKFIYDVWGDTVNMASRMESLGVPGRVQVTHAMAERLRGAFEVEPRGLIEVKGKGPTPTYFLLNRSEAAERIDGPSRAALA
ncbi:MAG TPA: adenylate/guanylate cyclase domain-containing protein [Candidatus Limnocylindrales bacterium]|nr:adenylate/guanylate cyclase domain-containing protein [Candidatus Limnocylindrales bacterium]